MKRSLLLAALVTTFTLCPIAPVNAESSLVPQTQIDSAISKYLPGFTPCPLLDREYLGFRCVCSNQSGIVLFDDMRYIMVTTKDDGLIVIQDGDLIYFIQADDL